MPYLQIGAVVVKASDVRRLEDEKGGGPLRTLSGQLRGTAVWSKRAWEATAYAADDAAAAAIRAAISATAGVNVSGDVIGSTVSCRVVVTGENWDRANNTSHFRMLSLSIREV